MVNEKLALKKIYLAIYIYVYLPKFSKSLEYKHTRRCYLRTEYLVCTYIQKSQEMFTERNTDGTVSPLMCLQVDLRSRRRQSRVPVFQHTIYNRCLLNVYISPTRITYPRFPTVSMASATPQRTVSTESRYRPALLHIGIHTKCMFICKNRQILVKSPI